LYLAISRQARLGESPRHEASRSSPSQIAYMLDLH
jgi:hypothetical protein